MQRDSWKVQLLKGGREPNMSLYHYLVGYHCDRCKQFGALSHAQHRVTARARELVPVPKMRRFDIPAAAAEALTGAAPPVGSIVHADALCCGSLSFVCLHVDVLQDAEKTPFDAFVPSASFLVEDSCVNAIVLLPLHVEVQILVVLRERLCPVCLTSAVPEPAPVPPLLVQCSHVENDAMAGIFTADGARPLAEGVQVPMTTFLVMHEA